MARGGRRGGEQELVEAPRVSGPPLPGAGRGAGVERLLEVALAAASALAPVGSLRRGGRLGRVLPAIAGSASALGVRRGPLRPHPLTPAAVRVERSRSRGYDGGGADQTAMTVWFGVGPDLPGVAPRRGEGSTALRLGTRLLGAAALAAATGAASRLAEDAGHPRLRPAGRASEVSGLRRLAAPGPGPRERL